jgi:hypothetical protein
MPPLLVLDRRPNLRTLSVWSEGGAGAVEDRCAQLLSSLSAALVGVATTGCGGNDATPTAATPIHFRGPDLRVPYVRPDGDLDNFDRAKALIGLRPAAVARFCRSHATLKAQGLSEDEIWARAQRQGSFNVYKDPRSFYALVFALGCTGDNAKPAAKPVVADDMTSEEPVGPNWMFCTYRLDFLDANAHTYSVFTTSTATTSPRSCVRASVLVARCGTTTPTGAMRTPSSG